MIGSHASQKKSPVHRPSSSNIYTPDAGLPCHWPLNQLQDECLTAAYAEMISTLPPVPEGYISPP